MKCTYIIFRHKKPCRHVRTYFREGRFLYNVLALLQYFSRPIQLDTSTSSISASTNTSASASTSATSTSTISASTTSATKMSISLQFRAIYTRNSTKGLHPAPPKCRFYYSFVRSTRTILRKGCTQHRQIAILPAVSGDRHVRSYVRVAP